MMIPFDDPAALAESGLRYAITNGDLGGAGSACVSDDEGLTDHDESPRAA